MNALGFGDARLCVRWVLVLGHFLWQAAGVAILALTAARLLRRTSAQSRYVVLVIALAVTSICPVLTFCLVDVPPLFRPAPSDAAPGTPYEEVRATPVPLPISPLPLPAEDGPDIAAAQEPIPTSPPPPLHAAPTDPDARAAADASWLSTAAPYLMAAYVAGVLIMLARPEHGGSRPPSDSELLNA